MESMTNILCYIKKMLSDSQLAKRYTVEGKKMSAHKHLSFLNVCLFVLCRKNPILGFELLEYRMNFGRKIAKSSITVARQKVKFQVFRHILKEISHLFPLANSFKGFQLLAIDGSVIQLPKSPENTAKYNKDGKCSWPRGHAVAMYDVLNKFFIDCTFEPYPCNERLSAESLICENFSQNKQIVTIDRGFASFSLFNTIMENGKFFVCRAPKNFSKEVVELLKSAETDKTLSVRLDNKRTRKSRRSAENKTKPIKMLLRITKIQLSSGEYEILITNLSEKDFSIEDLHTIYGLRWGIETSFESLKNQLFLEQFHSILENNMLQEFYANLILYGLSSMLSKPVEEMVEKKPHNRPVKHEQRPDFNKIMVIFKTHFIYLMHKTAEEMKQLLNLLIEIASTFYPFYQPIPYEILSRVKSKKS